MIYPVKIIDVKSLIEFLICLHRLKITLLYLKIIFSERITIMKVFNNLEKMKPYYNEETNIYIFSKNNKLIDIKIDFDLSIECGIKARNINARGIKSGDIKAVNINSGDINAGNIKAIDINAGNIKAVNINSGDIKAMDINAQNIKALDINSGDINAGNINASNINAVNIKACDIKACDIKAWNIKANKISFYAVCFAYNTFVCNSIEGRSKNSKYCCLDSDVVIKSQKR